MKAFNKESPKVTVYITSHNYSRFLKESIDSVLKQTYKNWELFLLDDGSSDESFEIMKSYESSIVFAQRNKKAQGLRNCANNVLKKASGKYIIRLDADDYFDENALILMVDYLENNDIALVYSDWIYVNEFGFFTGKETRKKLNIETLVNDLAAHGACTMIRTKVLNEIGGYDTEFDKQDGYELWLKIIQNYRVGNINTPLFYYRKHGDSMSSDEKKLIISRRHIKNKIVLSKKAKCKNSNTAIIPVRNTSNDYAKLAFSNINENRNFLDKTILDVIKSNLFENIIVESDDKKVLDYVNKKYSSCISVLRPNNLLGDLIPLSKVIYSTVKYIEKKFDFNNDIIAVVPIHCPSRSFEDIIEGYNTLILNNVDQVISTYEDFDMHFIHSKMGMKPLNPNSLDSIRYEREALFVNNGAIQIFWREFLDKHSMYKGKIGHFTMEKSRSLQIKKSNDLISFYEKK
jgi:glycosyltransferase involved in cell wall biosynthesis